MATQHPLYVNTTVKSYKGSLCPQEAPWLSAEAPKYRFSKQHGAGGEKEGEH